MKELSKVSDTPDKSGCDPRSADFQVVVDFVPGTTKHVLSDCRYSSLNSVSQVTEITDVLCADNVFHINPTWKIPML
jgi:hypothetical protein